MKDLKRWILLKLNKPIEENNIYFRAWHKGYLRALKDILSYLDQKEKEK